MRPVPVLLLAAGRATRLHPLTVDTPKCLLDVGDDALLGHLWRALEGLSVSEIILVTGHGAERLRAFVDQRRLPFPVREVPNPDYDTTNNIVSAALGRPHCDQGFLLVNSDVLCDPSILRDALAPPGRNVLIVDPGGAHRSEAMKTRFRGGRLEAIGKDLDPSRADAEYVGIARFDAIGAAAFFEATDSLVAKGHHDAWYEAAIGVAAERVPFEAQDVGGRAWIEIDDATDLERATREILPRIRASSLFTRPPHP